MSKESKSPNRFADAPSDRPQVDRVEHANLDRPGAQAHPRASRPDADWSRYSQPPRWSMR